MDDLKFGTRDKRGNWAPAQPLEIAPFWLGKWNRIGRWIIDTEFHCRIDRDLDVGGTPGISPIISGRAWVVGTKQLMVDPDDPFQAGYRLSDTWPMEG